MRDKDWGSLVILRRDKEEGWCQVSGVARITSHIIYVVQKHMLQWLHWFCNKKHLPWDFFFFDQISATCGFWEGKVHLGSQPVLQLSKLPKELMQLASLP